MGKSNHFSGQPLYSQVIKLLNKAKILHFSHKNGGERYTKRFDCWIHLVVMLYAVIMRFDSLREITASLLAETHKLAHLGITFKLGAAHWLMPTRDARRRFLRPFTVICMPPTAQCFPRTAAAARHQNG